MTKMKWIHIKNSIYKCPACGMRFIIRKKWKCCPVCEQKLDGIVERQEYDRIYDVEKLKSDAKDLGYNIIPIKNREKLMPCVCGCKRRQHWSHYDAETGKYKEGLRFTRCGKEVWGDSEADAIHIWNETIQKEQNEQR